MHAYTRIVSQLYHDHSTLFSSTRWEHFFCAVHDTMPTTPSQEISRLRGRIEELEMLVRHVQRPASSSGGGAGVGGGAGIALPPLASSPIHPGPKPNTPRGARSLGGQAPPVRRSTRVVQDVHASSHEDGGATMASTSGLSVEGSNRERSGATTPPVSLPHGSMFAVDGFHEEANPTS